MTRFDPLVAAAQALLDGATPGDWAPWFGEVYTVHDADGGRLAIATNLRGRYGMGGRRSGDEVAANTRLLAAAPAHVRLLVELRQALEDAEKRCEWQPIESAPRDHTHIIVGAGDGPGWSCEAWFDPSREGWWMANTHDTDAFDGRVYPTHWQPMPLPPQPSTGETK